MTGAQLLVRNGLLQNNLDANHFQILNLDTSNLGLTTIPPSIFPPAHFFLSSWDAAANKWGTAQPSFTDLSGNLTTGQQTAITKLGTVSVGHWLATPVDAAHVPRLDLVSAPLDSLSLNNQRITNLGDPIGAQDAVTKSFMDDLLQGLSPHEAVRCASTTRLTPATLARAVDGVTLVAGDRVLVKDQGAGALAIENGVYIAATGPWVRAADGDSGAELDRALFFVLEGTQNGKTSWVQPATGTVVGTTQFSFVLFSVSTDILAGAGLQKIGDTISALGTAHRIAIASAIDIASDYVGQASINTLGVVTTGTWEADVLDPQHGGTGNINTHTIGLFADFLISLGTGVLSGPLEFILSGATHLTLPQGGIMATLAGVEKFTNKRTQKRVNRTVSAAKPAIDTDQTDEFYITSLGTNILSMTDDLSGTPDEGDELSIWIRHGGALFPLTINWGAAWAASTDLPLPTATIVGKWLYCRFEWLAEKLQWVLVSKLENVA